jgi:hypothetical protein
VQANSLAATCTFLDLFLQYTMGKRRKIAAETQNLFDCRIFRIASDRDEKPRAEILIAAADRHPAKGRDTLNNWYLGSLQEVPFNVARVICQMTNVTYDDSVRRKYIVFLWFSLAILIIGPVGYSVICSIPMDKIFSDFFFPLGPLIVFIVIQLKEHKTALVRLKEMREQAQIAWEACTTKGHSDEELERRAAKLQSKIFTHRAEGATLFDRVYWLCRPKQEIYGAALANKLIAEYKATNI